MLIKIYPALSAAIGGRDGVDGRRCSWMMLHSHLPYWETSPNLVLRCPLYWAQLAAVLGGVKLYYGSSILIKNYPTLSAAIGGWDGVDAKQTHLDVAPWHLPFWETSGFGFSEERCIE